MSNAVNSQNKIIFLEETMKIETKIILKNMILPYSAIKINANPRPPYSTLNPDTNSDSPSEKSNGVRFVSASEEINQIPAKGKKIKYFIHREFILTTSLMFKLKDSPR